MGNQLYHDLDQPKNVISKLTSVIKATLDKTNKHELVGNEKFIINYSHNSRKNDKEMDINMLDEKRIVFISLVGLIKTWKDCPLIKLFPALFILPLKQKWVYYPSKYRKEIESSFIYPVVSNLFDSKNGIKEFIQLLRWKDSQQLVFWMLNDCGTDTGNVLVSSVWHNFNTMLCSLIDPFTKNTYHPIMFDELWWADTKKYKSKYDVRIPRILKELYFVTMRYDAMKEIIYQSNPNSLHPITSYYQGIKPKVMRSITNKELLNLYEGETANIDIEQDKNANWFIFEDYELSE